MSNTRRAREFALKRRLNSRFRSRVLLGPLQADPKFRGSEQRPIRLTQRLTRKQNDVGIAVRDNLLGLLRICD
jgi:hypothetical protein